MASKSGNRNNTFCGSCFGFGNNSGNVGTNRCNGLANGYSTFKIGVYNNILSAIDVNDIREVKVLKNATAIYGARAANGIVMRAL